VERRLRSDVNIGTSLSGGIDSSSIVAAINALKKNFHTWMNVGFTASFPLFEKDETAFSKKVAQSFGITQHFITPTAADIEKYFSTLMYHQEEPLQSSSVFTQFMIYKLAKENNITVLLDGQGADETLGGYKKYTHWYLQQLIKTKPALFIQEKKMLKKNQLLGQWGIKNYFASFFPATAAKHLQSKALIHQNSETFIERDFLKKYQSKDSLQKPTIFSLEDILYYNTFHSGFSELLRYADRNSMAHSREVRLPFLYHELVEFIFSLPSSFKK